MVDGGGGSRSNTCHGIDSGGGCRHVPLLAIAINAGVPITYSSSHSSSRRRSHNNLTSAAHMWAWCYAHANRHCTANLQLLLLYDTVKRLMGFNECHPSRTTLATCTQCGANPRVRSNRFLCTHHCENLASSKSDSFNPLSPAKHVIMLSNSGRECSQPHKAKKSRTECTVDTFDRYNLERCLLWSGFMPRNARILHERSTRTFSIPCMCISIIMYKRTVQMHM